MAKTFILPRQVPINSSGNVYPGAKAYFFETGTTTPKATYSDAALTTPHTHPVVADAGGAFAPIYLGDGDYKLTLNNFSDALIYTADPIANYLISQADFDNLLETTQQSIIDDLLEGTPPYKRTAVEIAAGVTPLDYTYQQYNLLRYGAVGDDSTINNTAIANWKAVCDEGDAEGLIPEGQFKINASVELPRKVKCYGEITGNFDVVYQKYQHGWVYGLACEQFYLRGCYFCNVQNLFCQFADVDGFDGTYGTFWNEFIQWHVDKTLTIDITNFAVNLNTWRGGRIGYLHITGDQSLFAASQAHANSWDGCDFTDTNNIPSGALQDDTANEVNFMRGCYFEGGGTIDGNWHIWGYQGDATGMPPIDRFAHIMGGVGRNSRLSRDFISQTAINSARGGNWDILDSSGKPPSLTQSGGAGVSIATDNTEPSGIGLRYEGTFSAAFSGFTITMQPTGSDRFGILIYYKSTAAFAAVESNDGSGAVSQSVNPVSLASDWKLIRVCGPASTTSTTSVSLFAHGGGGGSGKFMAIGGFFACGEKAVSAPSRPQTRIRYGSAVYNPASLADGAGVTTTVSVMGATRGDLVTVSFDEDLQGILLTGWVSASDVVSVRFQNETGGAIDLANGNLRVQVQSPYA